MRHDVVKKALRVARKAGGGAVAPFAGYIHGDTGGRTDNKPIDVESGAYVIPADILSGLGEGNSHAGAAALHKLLGMDEVQARKPVPGQATMGNYLGANGSPTNMPYGPREDRPDQGVMKADGGPVGQPTPIVAASGEMVIPPDKVTAVGGGDLDRGHAVLDAMVKHVRSKTIKKLKSLPGPKKS